MIPVCVFAKPPAPESAKTRLASALGNERTAALARAMFVDVWNSVSACPGVRPILATTEFRNVPVDIPLSDIWLQGEGDLGARLERIMSRGLLEAPLVLAVGADSPILTSSHITGALDALDANDAVIGPCADGGFYLLGLRQCPAGLFSNLPWSSSITCQAVVRTLREHGFTVGQMETLFDIDVIDDLQRLYEYLASKPQVAPATRAWYSGNRSLLAFQ
jgi:rSAM/selenodomain-associated transferase 1